MASVGGDMSREQFLCSICLEVFCQPVTLACGHNFCKVCITEYWNGNLICLCPLCKTTYGPRPDLFVNTLISEMAAPFKRSPGERPAVDDNSHGASDTVRPGEVPCDICPGAKCSAMKSCLVCLASFCKTHLEPHTRVTAYKKHKLIDPVANLEDRMCKKHDKLLEIFCRSDQKCICVTCLNMEHKAHDTTSLKEECDQRQAELCKLRSKAEQMKVQQWNKTDELRCLLEQNNVLAAREKEKAIKVFSALVAAVQRSQVILIEEIETRRRMVEKLAWSFIKQLEKDMTELQRKIAELELSSHTEDHHQFLQTFTSVSSFPQVIDLDTVHVEGFQSMKTLWTDITQLEELLYEKIDSLPNAKLKMVDPVTGAGLIVWGCDRGVQTIFKGGRKVKNKIK